MFPLGIATEWRKRWEPIDAVVALYAAVTGILVAVFHDNVPERGSILLFHALVLLVIAVLPPRGAPWEGPRATDGWFRHVRGGLRFLRYTYLLPLVLPFFEEVQQTVKAVFPAAPYWFEPYLYEADRWLFGELPAVLMNGWVGMPQDEILHFFYFSYYLILISAPIIAWFGPKGFHGRPPGPAFSMLMTSALTSFILCFIWYPWLTARGPWENPELMAGMTPFQGIVFQPIMEFIVERGAVSGGCFPSSHVAGSWGMVFGLALYHRRAALLAGFLATGMSFACVYARYHHAVDVPAGFVAGALGATIAYLLTHRSGKTAV